MTNQAIEQEIKKVLCKHCNNTFLATKENFYTYKGCFIFSKCKECKKELSKKNEKNRKPRNRTEYNKAYHLKNKEKKALECKDI